MQARHLVLAGHRARKAEAVTGIVEGRSAPCPALGAAAHPHVTVLLDDAAAAGCSIADYYRERTRQAAMARAVTHLDGTLPRPATRPSTRGSTRRDAWTHTDLVGAP